jgi:hypothetical protein
VTAPPGEPAAAGETTVAAAGAGGSRTRGTPPALPGSLLRLTVGVRGRDRLPAGGGAMTEAAELTCDEIGKRQRKYRPRVG